jgi:signal transduction histidine kinase
LPRSQWLAIDAATPPLLRAREMRTQWERFLSGGRLNGEVRAPVADSWRRSLAAGVDPSSARFAPSAAGRDEAASRWEAHPLAQALPLIEHHLAPVACESEHLIVVSDADGVLLQLLGSGKVRSRAADSMNFTEGALWSERGAGTNAIGTAIAADHAVQIFATEHFNEVVQAWTCSAAPVHDPETGQLLGVIDMTGLFETVHPQSLAMVSATAQAVERFLRERLKERDGRLRAGRESGMASPGVRFVQPRNGVLVLPNGRSMYTQPLVKSGEPTMLAREQAALRRLANLGARPVPGAQVFAAVAREVGELLGVDATHIARYEPDNAAVGVGSWSRVGDISLVGERVPLDGRSVAASVRLTGRPGRIDGYPDGPDSVTDRIRRRTGIRSSVGAPITVEGRLWGVMIASSKQEPPLPPETESRIAAFTQLVATAIANAQAQAEVRRLADEQAALRRVATLVARQSPADEVFAAVAEEVGRLLGADHSKMYRYEPEGRATVVAQWGEVDPAVTVGTSLPVEGDKVAAQVLQAERPSRTDDYMKAAGPIGANSRSVGLCAAVGAPIVVEGRLWGAMVAATVQSEPLPADTEARIGQFTELVATAISNIEARSDLAESRARIVAAGDDERRRVVRDLHDGAQQRLVHTVVTLKLAQQALEGEQDSLAALIAEVLDHAEQATEELRELSHGILPRVLTRGGLEAGVGELASRMPVAVETDVRVGRLSASVEATAYFVVAEALTNVAKHSRAERAAVTAAIEDRTLRIRVRDDGIGGARVDGSGLLGLADRVAALEGRLRVDAPPDGGTLVEAEIPL